MSTLSARPLLPTFLSSVNALLAALALPFTIDHPTDLTPSLLLAIFESLINARLPIPASVRQSRTRDAKARTMLVLLGVLECDILRGGASTDAEHSVAASNADDSALGGAGGVSVDGWVDEIGLGEVDPDQLADGGWDETVFVGELLCWLARRKGILPRARSSHRFLHQRSLYSNHHSYGTEEGDTADFSTSLLLRPSSALKSQHQRPPSPSPPIDDMEADSSSFSHITDVPRHPLVYSPEPSFSASATTGTDLSIRARSVSSHTSVSVPHEDLDDFVEASQETVQMYDPHRLIQSAEEDDDRPPTFRPRCIHELEDPSYIRALQEAFSSFDQSGSCQRVSVDEYRPSKDDGDEQDVDDLYAPSTPTPRRVRLTGWIETVDAATELSHFAASRSRSHAFNATAGSCPIPPSQAHRQARTTELSTPTSHLRTVLPYPVSGKSHASYLASSSPSLLPSSPPLTSSKRLSARSPPSHPPSPSPPSSPTEPDASFDVSFSTLNNTSTPAKLRPSQRPYLRPRNRSPSYTPSPPSLSTSGGGAGSTGLAPSSWSGTDPGPRTRAPPTTARMRNPGDTSLSPITTTGKSPPQLAVAGSTATTSTLLTERARLLTELAALKRARAASGGGGVSGVGTGVGVGTGGERGMVGQRIGVGVRS